MDATRPEDVIGTGDDGFGAPARPGRLIEGPIGAPALEWIEAGPSGPGSSGAPSSGAPLLFLHGAFAGAWMWDEVFLPHFARRGRHVAAVSLRGHGRSEGRDRLRTASLADFVEDLERAVARCPAPPVLVAHSLGGLVAQRLVGRARLAGLVLMASLPPDGMALMGPRLALTEPLIWSEGVFGSLAKARGPVADAARRLLFTEGLPPGQIRRYAAMMRPESPRAFLDAHVPAPIVPAFAVGLPTLVMGGTLDRLVWLPSRLRTALYHGGEHVVVPGVGHFMQIDVGAEEVARRLLDWLERRGL